MGVVWPWLAAWRVVGAALRRPGGESASGIPLVALVLGWVLARWGGVYGSDILLGIFLSIEASGV